MYRVLCVVAQSCPTLWPMNCGLPGSSVHGDSLDKKTGVVVMPSSRGSSQPRDRTRLPQCRRIFFTIWDTREAQEYWSGSLLHDNFPTQGSNPCLLHLLHWRAGSLPLSHLVSIKSVPPWWHLNSTLFTFLLPLHYNFILLIWLLPVFLTRI